MTASNEPSGLPSVSIVVPTYKEAENIPLLADRIEKVRDENGLDLELLIMDDDSDDGTEQVVADLNKPWIRLVVRKEDRGLSPAVVDGMRLATKSALVCMDADLSHPPEAIPELLEHLTQDYDFVIGSRYVEGGSTDSEWNLFRRLNSRAATWMARPFTRARDPMSGFFAISRERFEQAQDLNPIGYKIGLELIVKGRCEFIKEVPIHFSDRKLGESKLTLAEQLRYIQHLRRLFIYKYGGWAHFLQFAVVGGLGTVVNLAVLTLLDILRVPLTIAVAAAILTAMVFNFALNRRFTFSYARTGSLIAQFMGFVGASSLGAVVNYAVAITVLRYWPSLERFPQVAALAGIAAGMVVNYAVSRYLVFRKPRRPRPAA
jgi:dolichol-phosphate mannosyltransferase